MALPLVTKISTGVVGIGAVTGGGIFIAYKSLNQETITKYLNSLGREVAISDSDWELIKKNYSSNKEDNPILGILKSSIDTKLNDLKKWCNERLNEKFSKEKADNGDYNLIQAWCTKQVKISAYLKNLKLTSLDTKGPNDNNRWTQLKDSYSGSNLKINEITGQEGNKTEGTIVNGTLSDNQKLKTWCSWASDQYFKHEKDSLFKRYKYFCTKASD